LKGFSEEGKGTVRDDQTVAEMANEVLMRQAKARADRSGEPIEEAMEAVLNTEAGKQLKELRDGPHGDEGVEEWQVSIAQERARERVEQLGKRLEETPEHPAHGWPYFREPPEAEVRLPRRRGTMTQAIGQEEEEAKDRGFLEETPAHPGG
jgi:hypothetical protein